FICCGAETVVLTTTRCCTGLRDPICPSIGSDHAESSLDDVSLSGGAPLLVPSDPFIGTLKSPSCAEALDSDDATTA
ncbi:MAG TPA: hypothetical protein V6C69_05115, partial [Trichormus sp.]